MRIFLLVLDILLGIILVTAVLMQPSKANGLQGFMGGTTETFYSKNKSRTREAMLIKVTVVTSILFALVTIGLNLVK